MAKVIDIGARRERVAARDAARARAREVLARLSGELFDAAFGVAVAEAWRAWDEATPELREVELAPEALLDECADAEVRMLARVWVAVDEALEAMGGGDGGSEHRASAEEGERSTVASDARSDGSRGASE